VRRRLPARPGESIDRAHTVRFSFEGKRMQAFEGDTVGSALAAAGVDITARSFKYHRPRGLFCMTGSCPNCLMQIDGIPNVRSCTEPVRDGMKVERQNAWPSVDRDIHGWLNRFSFMMPRGFYYKVFQHPKWAWPLVEPLIRSKAGRGVVPRDGRPLPRRPVADQRRREPLAREHVLPQRRTVDLGRLHRQRVGHVPAQTSKKHRSGHPRTNRHEPIAPLRSTLRRGRRLHRLNHPASGA